MIFQIWDNDKFSFDDFLGEHHFRSTILPISVSQSPSCARVCLSLSAGLAGGSGSSQSLVPGAE